MQYLLGKDNTSPVKVEVDAPQQHPDAIGIWRRIVYTYEDGCQIVLEGEGFESEGKVPYIEGPKGKVYKGFECTIPDVMNKLAELPDPEPQNTDFIKCIRNRRTLRARRNQGLPQRDAGEHGPLRAAAQPHAPFRSREAALRRR